jgi:signal peptide peptidase SppA
MNLVVETDLAPLYSLLTLSLSCRFEGLLEKYGIQLHVFKHGAYKNFPNTFTEVTWTAAHRENVRNILDAMNADVCADITTARSKALLSSWYTKHYRSGNAGNDDIWKRIHESGTFPAETAWKGGLVDYLPRRDPLPALLRSNANTKEKVEARKDWKPHETDFVPFKANEAVSLSQYAGKVKKLMKAEERKKKWLNLLREHPSVVAALSSLGVSVPDVGSPKKEKIALLYVQGDIGDGQARKTINAIRKIGQDKDTKCLVLRVSSPGGRIFPCEAISEELKALNVPVVVSFGNVAASGGYYISAMANRVFASHKTVTGSIGVFGMRADLTGLTDRYGIKVKYEASGDLSATYASFHPMTNKMKRVMMESIDRYYDQFKEVVSSGRRMSFDDVELIAQGRVWTGDQAKRNGLVDELGGLYRAIAYARRNFTESDADVVVWPKKRSFMERVLETADKGDGYASPVLFTALRELFFRQKQPQGTDGGAASEVALLQRLVSSYPYGLPGTLSGAFYSMDEDAALRCLVESVEESSRRS